MSSLLYRQVNIALEAFCVILCALLLFYFYLGRKTADRSARWFVGMTASNIVMLLGDMVHRALTGVPGAPAHYALWVGITLYFAASGTLMLAFLAYVILYLKQSAQVSKNWFYAGAALSGAQILLALVTPLTHAVFYISADNLHYRGPLVLLTQLLAFSLYSLIFALLIRHRKVLAPGDLAFFLSYIIVPLIAELVQFITYEIAALNVALSLELVLIFIFIQTETALNVQQKENLHMARLQAQQENLIRQIITVLSGTVEAKDLYTHGHAVRVAAYARQIVRRMGGTERQQTDIYYMGLLHDIGKIRVPDTIINKQGRLTNAEFDQMKLHTVAGYHILKEVTAIPDLASGARWHHERYDGSGYPNGLSGEDIPLVARIISVADAYDAMTSDRSYRGILPQERVRAELVKGKGTQFDPAIDQIMLDMIDEDTDYRMKQEDAGEGYSILVIDDDPVVFEFVKRALMDGGYELTFIDDADQGIRAMEEREFDLVLLDVEMPGRDGFAVLQWIRENKPRLRVIFLTGDKELQVIKRGEELGVNDYVTKPIFMPALRECVSNVLRH